MQTTFKHRVISGTMITIALLMWCNPIHQSLERRHIGQSFHTAFNKQRAIDVKNALLVQKISNRYTHVPVELVADVVKYTGKYAKPDFPTQADLLAVIAVESSFNPNAKSKLKRDPAIGLTQIRPNAWKHKLDKVELASIENQIKYGSEILSHNYQRVNNKALALHAYNLGLTAMIKGRRSKTYVVKYERELNYLEKV